MEKTVGSPRAKKKMVDIGGPAVAKKKLNIAMLGHKHVFSREGGIEIVVNELATRMAARGHQVTCYDRNTHHVSGEEKDWRKEYKGIKIIPVWTIEKKGLAAMTSSLSAAWGKYDVVHIHAEGPAAMSWLPKIRHKRVIVTVHGDAQIISRKNIGLMAA